MRRIKKITRLLLLLFALGLLYVAWQYVSISRFAAHVKPVPSDAIIVLGAEVRGDQPSPALRERCEWALQLYKEGYAKTLILSGGLGGGTISEAEAMHRFFQKAGVPERAMLLEDRSHDTRENLTYSKAIMEAHGLKTAIICTHLFHQKRAHVLAEKLGMQTTGYGQDSPSMFDPFWQLRETASMVKVYLGM